VDGLGLHPAPSSRSPLSARAFGPEVLLGELIGRGGMSRVYRGWLRANGAEVAVKILRDDLASSPDAVQRFIRERDLLAAVASPHVVRVHDLVVHEDEVGIVMDLVAGGHLRKAVSFPCPPQQAAELTTQIADGLAAVHATGVIHRDLKPENVLVDGDGAGGVVLRLTDFGISRLVDAGTLTQTTVTGTPGYLPPEVAGGGKVTAAADVYALGIVLYELCTGRGPFLADNPLVLILAATRQQAPRPGGMPDPLWELLAAMLAKDPTARPTAAQVAASLRALLPALGGLPLCTAPPPAAVEPTPPSGSPAAAAQTDAATAAQTVASAAPQPAASPYQLLPGAPLASQPPRSRRESLGTLPPAPGDDARRGLLHRPRVIAAAIAGTAALTVLAILGIGMLTSGDDDVVPQLPTQAAPTVDPSTPSLTPSSAPTHSPSPVIHTVAPTPSTSPPSSGPTPAKGGATGASPSPTPSPGVPILSRTVDSSADMHASDQQAKITIAGVTPGAGRITSIAVSYDAAHTQQVPLTSASGGTYRTVVEGLTNGKPYVFTVKVCASTKLCTASAPYLFTPYGSPEVQAPRLSVTGLTVTVATGQVVRHSNPGKTTCTVSVTPADGTPQLRPVAPGGETFTFTGRATTTYLATQSCATDGFPDGTATSTAVTTGAAPPSTSPAPSTTAPTTTAAKA
jgi:serine/threonine-protein kinase